MLLKLSQLILLFDVVFDTLLYKLFFIKELKTSLESCFFFTIFMFSQISMRPESKRTWVFANNHYINVIKSIK